MKNQIIDFSLVIAFLSIFYSSCMIPVNSSFESAKLLEKEQIELSGGLGLSVLKDSSSNYIGNEIGIGLGYGFTDNFDLKIRYVRQSFPEIETDEIYSWDDVFLSFYVPKGNYFAITPKFNLWEQRLSMMIPVVGQWGKSHDDKGYIGTGLVSPRILYTVVQQDKFDLTLSAKVDLGLIGIIPGGNLGFGFSPDEFEKFRIHLDIGWQLGWNAGIGGAYYFENR